MAKNIKVAVTGDIAVNNIQWRTVENNNKGYNWESYPHVFNSFNLGKDFLLSKLISQATDAEILSPQIMDNSCMLNDDTLVSKIEAARFPMYPYGSTAVKVYRVKEFLGFSGPKSGVPQLFSIDIDDEACEIVVLDDENNGFNSSREYWPKAIITEGSKPLIIYKTSNIDSSNLLWKHLESVHLENTIVVINADDLRAKGVNISKSLSWERTALDFAWQMDNNSNLSALAKCQHLIVPLGVEGALHYKHGGKTEADLYFLTYEFEGGFIREGFGKMYGLTSCFVAGLVSNIVAGMRKKEDLEYSLSEGIRQGIVAAQKYFLNGFGSIIDRSPFPDPSIFIEGENDVIYKEKIQDVKIRNSKNPNCHSCWYIMKDKHSVNLSEIGYDIVKNGENSALKFIPIARFRNLKTVDRTEIESYRSVKNLITEYLSGKNSRPLSIAVFGTPGSGKSFGVTEVAASIAPDLIKKLDFNLSQFQSINDLVAAFHKVRDLSLEGKIPLVFFDEFDSSFNSELGWLKYFLAPMQDGVFREGDALHPIGKAIFVFAGGTSSTYNEFCREDIGDKDEGRALLKAFQNAKGPDFISRLRGYVNILGPNQTDAQWDQLFIIRRAMLLRALIERKAPFLINDNGEVQIDNGVLRAMLKVPVYKHESRSMEAILDMSILSGAKKWEQAHLPSKEQLKLHVDEEQFSRLLMQNEFFSEKLIKLAIELYSKNSSYYENAMNSSRGVKPWHLLSEAEKSFVQREVRHIPVALNKINYEVISVNENQVPIVLTDKEVLVLAEYEHKRSSLEKKETGWVHGKKYEEGMKTTPYLVPWDELPAEYANKIIQNVRLWPEVLANQNFTIERLKFLCHCEANMVK